MIEPLQRSITRIAQHILSRQGVGGFARRGIGVLALRVASLALGFIVAMVLARALGVAGFGVYSYVFALVSLLIIPAKFGLPSLVVREVASAQAGGDWGRLRGVIRWSNYVAGAFALVLILAGGCVALLLAGQIGHTTLKTFIWGLVLVPPLVLGDLRGAALRGLHRIVEGQLPEFVLRPGILAILCGAYLLFMPRQLSPDAAMALHALASLAAFAAGACLFLRARPAAVRTTPPIYEPSAWLRAALPLALAASMQVLMRQIDTIVLGYYRPAEEVGLYRAAIQASMLVSLGLTAVTQVAAPQFAALHARGELKRLQQVSTSTSRLGLVIAAPVATIMIFEGGTLLRLMYGKEFSPGHAPLAVLAIGQLVNAAFGAVVALLSMTRFENRAAVGATIAAVMNLLLNLALVPYFGAVGAATAASVSLAAWNVLLWRDVRRHVGVDTSPIPVRQARPVD